MSKNALTALAGVGVALLAGLVILWAQGYPALPSYAALFSYSLFSKFAIVSTLNKATPLVLTGLSAAVGFGSNCVNLGQPGQFLIGAMAGRASATCTRCIRLGSTALHGGLCRRSPA